MKKTVLVTGGSKGIGTAIVRAFIHNEYNVAFTYNKSEENALMLVKELEIDNNILAIKCDVSNMEDVSNMVKMAYGYFCNIDILVNNAGIALEEKLLIDVSENEYDEVMNINIKGVFNTCKQIIPNMLKNKSGNIINISSIYGISGASCETIYSASKAAIIGLSQGLAKELGPSNINVNVVAPGAIDTDMISSFNEDELNYLKEQTPLSRIGSPEEIADVVVFMASDGARFITGQVISPNGGLVI